MIVKINCDGAFFRLRSASLVISNDEGVTIKEVPLADVLNVYRLQLLLLPEARISYNELRDLCDSR